MSWMEGGVRLNGHRELPTREPASELREYLHVLLSRKLSILLVAGASVAAALSYSARQPPMYASTARVLVNQIVLFSQVGAFKPNIDTERQVVDSEAVASLAAAELEGNPDPDELLSGLSVGGVPETEILNIRYAHPDPQEPQRRAQAFASAYLEFRRQQMLQDQSGSVETIEASIQDLNSKLDTVNARIATTSDPLERTTLDSQANVLISRVAFLQQRLSDATSNEVSIGRVVTTASPAGLVPPNHVGNGLVALFVGLVAGVGVAFLRERLDDRLRGRDDLAALADAPVLAVIPVVRQWQGRHPSSVTEMAPGSPAFESFRTLRANLLFAAGQEKVKTVMVTSAGRGEGKTALTANLGIVLAAAGKKVVLVSADLRRPRLDRFFGIDTGTGRAEVLAGPVNHLGVWEPNRQLDLVGVGTGRMLSDQAAVLVGPAHGSLPASEAQDGAPRSSRRRWWRPRAAGEGVGRAEPGAVVRRPSMTGEEIWGSDEMKERLLRWRDVADIVLIDTPAVLPIADASSLAPFTDAVLLVADASRTSRESVRRAREQLDQVGTFVVGAVLNRFHS